MKSKTFQRILNNTPNDIKIFVDIYADLVVRINQIIKDKNIITSDKPELTKWLNGESDLTLKSISLISTELGEPLLIVPKNIKEKSTNHSKNYVEDQICRTEIYTFISNKLKSIDCPDNTADLFIDKCLKNNVDLYELKTNLEKFGLIEVMDNQDFSFDWSSSNKDAYFWSEIFKKLN